MVLIPKQQQVSDDNIDKRQGDNTISRPTFCIVFNQHIFYLEIDCYENTNLNLYEMLRHSVCKNKKSCAHHLSKPNLYKKIFKYRCPSDHI